MYSLKQEQQENPLAFFFFFTCFSLFLLRPLPALAIFPAQVFSLETFEEDAVLSFPKRWQVRGDAEAARAVYRIMAEGQNQFLHASTDKQAVQIGLSYAFAPEELPWLRWRWRVTHLPVNANEAYRGTHDSAAGVYAIFDNRLFPRIIKYVWSTTLPIGARVQNPLYWRAKIVVLASGTAALGEWRQETVNVLRDYQDLFGEEPGKVLAIGLSTSASFTKSLAVADYDDFALLPPTALSTETGLSMAPRRSPH